MNRPVQPEARDIWRKWSRAALEELFAGYSEQGQVLTPDRAMEELPNLLKSVAAATASGKRVPGEQEGSGHPFVMPQFDWVAFEREAHKYAVDLYYKTYFPKSRGAPKLEFASIEPLLALKQQGLGYKRIADALGLTKDTVRDRLKPSRRKRKKPG